MFSENVKTCLKSDIWFLIEYGLFLTLEIIQFSNFYSPLDGIVIDVLYASCWGLISIHLLFYFLFSENRSLLRMVGFVLLLALIVLLNGFSFYGNDLLYIAILYFLGKDTSNKKTIYLTIAIMLAMLVITDICSRIGIIKTNIEISEYRNTRNSLGFGWYLYASEFAFNISALYIYLKKNSIKWIELLLLISINTYYYLNTDSRLSFGLSLVIVIIAAVLKVFPRLPEKVKPLHFLAVSLYTICALISVLFAIFYDDSVSWMSSLNSILEGRLSNARNTFDTVGISLIGDKSSLYLDNAYVQYFFWGGLIISIILLAIHTIAVYRSWIEKDYYLEIILCILALHGLVDDLITMLCFNTFWIMALSIVFKRKSFDSRFLEQS